MTLQTKEQEDKKLGILYIVIISTVVLILLFAYDKREFILNFFKSKFFKPKPLEIPKIKPQIDTDTIPDQGKMKYGKVYNEPSEQSDDEIFEFDNIFSPKDKDTLKDDIDLDKMFDEMRLQEAHAKSELESDQLDEEVPNFENMSMEELDSLIEDKFKNGKENQYIPFGTSGEELGNTIRSLPPQIKVLIASDILKKKDDND